MKRVAKRKMCPSVGVEALEQRLLFTASELIRNGSFEGRQRTSTMTGRCRGIFTPIRPSPIRTAG